MTWVDFVVVGILAVSGLLAFMRGFVREVLGIAAWAGAVAFAWWGTPLARPQFERWISSPEWIGLVTNAVLFLAALIMLMIVSSWLGRVVRASALGGVDRTLGLVFGLARGALLVVFAYIAGNMVIPIEQWPPAVQHALLLRPAYTGAAWAVDHLPQNVRPHLAPPPAHETTAAELLSLPPQGRAVGPSPRQQTRN